MGKGKPHAADSAGKLGSVLNVDTVYLLHTGVVVGREGDVLLVFDGEDMMAISVERRL